VQPLASGSDIHNACDGWRFHRECS
jgi:hypothetical protein